MSDLTKACPGNPFVKSHNKYGREEHYLDFAAFAPALAEALGGTVESIEDCTVAGSARLRVDGLRLFIRPEIGASFGKVEVNSGQPELEKLIHYSERPRFPSGKFDTGRPIAKLAADIKRRIVAEAELPTANLKAIAERTRNHRRQLESSVAKLQAKFPAVQITVKDDTNTLTADVYYHGGGAYLYGRLNADGSLYVDRISGADPVQLFKALGL